MVELLAAINHPFRSETCIERLRVMMSGTALELTDPLRGIFQDTAKCLKGTERLQFMAQVVQALGPGGQA